MIKWSLFEAKADHSVTACSKFHSLLLVFKKILTVRYKASKSPYSKKKKSNLITMGSKDTSSSENLLRMELIGNIFFNTSV